MAGNSDNVKLWTEADVLIYKQPTLDPADLPADVTEPFDTTVPWDAAAQATVKWGFLGFLVGADGFDRQREWTETDIPAFGYGTILVASKDYKETRRVNYREDNAVTRSIEDPGSSSSDLVIPDPPNFYIAFELRTADGYVKRHISRKRARLWVPNQKEVEGDNVPRELSARIFPNSARQLYIVQEGDAA